MNYTKPDITEPRDTVALIRKHLVIASVASIFALAIPLSLLHNASVEIYGISEFGVHIDTAIPLGIGLFIASFNIWAVANHLRSKATDAAVAQSFRAISILIVLIVLTPYAIDTIFNWIHMVIGTLLFLDQLALSIHVIKVCNRETKLVLLFALEIFGGILAALSLPNHMLSYMFQGEVLFQIGFALILFKGLAKLVGTESSPQTSIEGV